MKTGIALIDSTVTGAQATRVIWNVMTRLVAKVPSVEREVSITCQAARSYPPRLPVGARHTRPAANLLVHRDPFSGFD
jgi:hypothetical protein